MMDGNQKKRIVEVSADPRAERVASLAKALKKVETPMAFRTMFKVGGIKETGDTVHVEALQVPDPDPKDPKHRDAPAIVKVEGVLSFAAPHPELMRVLRANKGGIVYLDLTPAE